MCALRLSSRALHWVFKVGDRSDTINFLKNTLGMKVLRHEEFSAGCDAQCNGPYDGKWSKTMIGYGSEDHHFVLELTYNYGIDKYRVGNDFRGLTIESSAALERARTAGLSLVPAEEECFITTSPDGYAFVRKSGDQPERPLRRVSLSTSNLERTIAYWRDFLGMSVVKQEQNDVVFSYGKDQVELEFVLVESVDHGTAFGRIAFSVPEAELESISAGAASGDHKVLTPLISLDTPGKATVKVIILADPDGYEICFVGDEAFRELSQVDPKGDDLLTEAMKGDQSKQWFAKKGKSKGEA